MREGGNYHDSAEWAISPRAGNGLHEEIQGKAPGFLLVFFTDSQSDDNLADLIIQTGRTGKFW